MQPSPGLWKDEARPLGAVCREVANPGASTLQLICCWSLGSTVYKSVWFMSPCYNINCFVLCSVEG